jgi:site-specific DNA recombinase
MTVNQSGKRTGGLVCPNCRRPAGDTANAMRDKAKQGLVTGGKLFGYDNVRQAKGQTTRTINDAEAAVVRDIYTRFAAGQGLRSIALALNTTGALSPRAQQGRPNGWSATSVREVLGRPVYRGTVVYGKTKVAYGRELGPSRDGREEGQIDAAIALKEQQ